jgi:glycosyltransferase involved in cell wall biosynthesis
MRIAHCATIAPNRCGLYGTARDLVRAEIAQGLDAGFIDAAIAGPNTTIVNGKLSGYPKVSDSSMQVQSMEWGKKADVYIRHSFIPVQWQNSGTPLVMALHGRPESSFRLEQQGNSIVSTVAKRAIDKRYKTFWCFWPEYIPIWQTIIPNEKLCYIPAPVDLEYYCPEGPIHKHKDEHNGSPNILIADMWREDVIPFNPIFAALKFQQKYCSTAKLHIVALQGSNLKIMGHFLNGIQGAGALGSISTLTKNIIPWYRSADIVITPQTIATRTVREPLACGVPVVAGAGNKYTPYTASHMDVDAFASAINDCWQDIKSGPKLVKAMARKTAEMAFNLDNTGKAIKKSLEAII